MNLQYLGEARGRWDKLSAKMKYACGSVEWLSSNLNTKATPFVCGYTVLLKSQTSFLYNVKRGDISEHNGTYLRSISANVTFGYGLAGHWNLIVGKILHPLT